MHATTPTTLSIEEVIDRGTRIAGVSDPEPDKFRPNLASLVSAINDQDPMTARGEEDTTDLFAKAWAKRIAIDDWYRREPLIQQEAIDSPLAMIGLPRSGSTYFQYLFDQDPEIRMLRTWEGLQPCPPPGLDLAGIRSRIETLADGARHGVAVVPFRSDAEAAQFHAMHLTDLEGPQECVGIMDQTFCNVGDYWRHSVPRYFDELSHTLDLDGAYDHHKRSLQTLQYKSKPKRWVLKWPCHLMALNSLVRTYPDVRLIVTHRDPVRALASNCSLALFVRRTLSQNPDSLRVGRDMRQVFSYFIRSLLDFDSRSDLQPMVHVDYYELLHSPASAMETAFRKLGLPFTAQVRARVSGWRESNPQGKRGRHDYQLSDFGLREEEIAEEFSEYIDRFAIRCEGR